MRYEEVASATRAIHAMNGLKMDPDLPALIGKYKETERERRRRREERGGGGRLKERGGKKRGKKGGNKMKDLPSLS